MAEEADVLFVRGSGNRVKSEDNDVWDDSVLIEAYEKAVNATKEEILKRICPESKESQPAKQPKQKWAVGQRCRAVYTDDGEVYEATVLKIFENSGTCIVKFAGYGNTQKVRLDSLLDTGGPQSIQAQEKNALVDKIEAEAIEVEEAASTSTSTSKNGRRYNGSLGDRMECEAENAKCFKNKFMGPPFNSMMDSMPPAPPLPPQLMAKLPENDADALSSMLMSWYISGFHTGYYHGLKQAQSNQERKKNC